MLHVIRAFRCSDSWQDCTGLSITVSAQMLDVVDRVLSDICMAVSTGSVNFGHNSEGGGAAPCGGAHVLQKIRRLVQLVALSNDSTAAWTPAAHCILAAGINDHTARRKRGNA